MASVFSALRTSEIEKKSNVPFQGKFEREREFCSLKIRGQIIMRLVTELEDKYAEKGN